MNWTNWAGTITANPSVYERPADEEELQSVLEAAEQRDDTVRVAGSGHSFSPVVPTDETLISLERFQGIVDIDENAKTVTVRAGTTLADLNHALAIRGLALENLGDIDRQTVAGALTTGTHGTGLDFGILATAVKRIRLMRADGEVVTLERDDEGTGDRFQAAQVSLGALGVITTVTLNVIPAYNLCLRRRRMPLSAVLDTIESFHDAHRQWEFFWFPHTDAAIVKTFDTVPADSTRSVADGSDGGGIVEDGVESIRTNTETMVWDSLCRLGASHPWTAPSASRLAAWTLSDKTVVGPSHSVFATPRKVRFHETEYGVPAADLPAVIESIREYIDSEAVPVQFPIECRFVGGDEPLLSPAHGRDSAFVAVHAHHEKNLEGYFERCESIFDQYGGRPHWGKQHAKTATELANLYPAWDAFQTVRSAFDPNGRFLNEHLQSVFQG